MLKLPKETHRRILLAVIVITLCAIPSWYWYQDYKTHKIAKFIYECSQKDYFQSEQKYRDKIKVICKDFNSD